MKNTNNQEHLEAIVTIGAKRMIEIKKSYSNEELLFLDQSATLFRENMIYRSGYNRRWYILFFTLYISLMSWYIGDVMYDWYGINQYVLTTLVVSLFFSSLNLYNIGKVAMNFRFLIQKTSKKQATNEDINA